MSISENNKEQEIVFNAKALTSAWLDGFTKIDDLRLVFDGESTNCTIPCEKASCGLILGEKLANNGHCYNHVKLIGRVGKEDKVFGEMEIK
jgi:hypothetical protein